MAKIAASTSRSVRFGTARAFMKFLMALTCAKLQSGVMSPSIGEALADAALYGCVGARHVVNAQRDAMVVPEVELAQIAMQVLLTAVLIDALHTALEDREVALDGVGVRVPAHVLFGRV